MRYIAFAKSLVQADVAGAEIGIPIVLAAAVEVEREALGDRNAELRPAAGAVNGRGPS